jgi:hypothetical protein
MNNSSSSVSDIENALIVAINENIAQTENAVALTDDTIKSRWSRCSKIGELINDPRRSEIINANTGLIIQQLENMAKLTDDTIQLMNNRCINSANALNETARSMPATIANYMSLGRQEFRKQFIKKISTACDYLYIVPAFVTAITMDAIQPAYDLAVKAINDRLTKSAVDARNAEDDARNERIDAYLTQNTEENLLASSISKVMAFGTEVAVLTNINDANDNDIMINDYSDRLKVALTRAESVTVNDALDTIMIEWIDDIAESSKASSRASSRANSGVSTPNVDQANVPSDAVGAAVYNLQSILGKRKCSLPNNPDKQTENFEEQISTKLLKAGSRKRHRRTKANKRKTRKGRKSRKTRRVRKQRRHNKSRR